MKLKKNFKRWLSILLVVAVSLSSVMPMPMYAAEGNGGQTQNSVTETVYFRPLFKIT